MPGIIRVEMLYCSRCARAIPPGGLDEGRYYTVGKETVCPKCYHKLKPEQHTGGTIASAHPIEERLRMPGSRVGPAVRPGSHAGQGAKPGSRVGPAARPPTTRVGPAARDASRPKPPTRSLPAARRGLASSSSTRLVAIKSADARLRLYAIGLVVLAIFLGLLLLMVHNSGRKAKPAAPQPTPTPTVDHGKPAPPGQDNFRRPVQTPTPPPDRTPATPGGGEPKPGLNAQYYLFAESDNADFLPADRRKKPIVDRVDTQINFELTEGQFGNSGLTDRFCAVWSGVIRIEKAGSYKFYLNSDDGSRLSIDDKVVVNNGGCHPPEEKDGTVELTAGDHAITVEFFESTAGACCILSWEPPGGQKEVVPAGAFFHTHPATPK